MLRLENGPNVLSIGERLENNLQIVLKSGLKDGIGISLSGTVEEKKVWLQLLA